MVVLVDPVANDSFDEIEIECSDRIRGRTAGWFGIAPQRKVLNLRFRELDALGYQGFAGADVPKGPKYFSYLSGQHDIIWLA